MTFELETLSVKGKKYLRDVDILKWLRLHADAKPDLAEVFNALIDELLSVKEVE